MVVIFVVRDANLLFMYNLQCFVGIVAGGTEVTLISPNSETLPLPYLAFHAAVAKVVLVAGMAEYLDDKLRKYEDIRVPWDQSGAEYLDGLLRIAQRYIVTH